MHLVSSSNNEHATTIKIDPKELHSVLLSIFGFALITFTALPAFNLIVAFLNRGINFDPATDTAFSSDFPLISYGLLFGYSFQLLLGIWFAFGAKGISGIIYKLRYSKR